jgi:cell division protease FtsH
MGRDYGHQRDYSEEIAAWIDEEVRALIEAAHDEAWEILVQYRDVLDQLVLELAERETLNKEDLERILAPVHKRPPHSTFAGFGKRTPSDRPPIEIPAAVRSNGSSNGLAKQGAPQGEQPAGGYPASSEPQPAGAASDPRQQPVSYPPAPGYPQSPGYPPPQSYPPLDAGYPPSGSTSPDRRSDSGARHGSDDQDTQQLPTVDPGQSSRSHWPFGHGDDHR